MEAGADLTKVIPTTKPVSLVKDPEAMKVVWSDGLPGYTYRLYIGYGAIPLIQSIRVVHPNEYITS